MEKETRGRGEGGKGGGDWSSRERLRVVKTIKKNRGRSTRSLVLPLILLLLWYVPSVWLRRGERRRERAREKAGKPLYR